MAALKAGIEVHDRDHHVLFDIPFDSERKAMSVVVLGADGTPVMYTKGAPEVILAKCIAERCRDQIEPLTDARRGLIMNWNLEMAALRCARLRWRIAVTIRTRLKPSTKKRV